MPGNVVYEKKFSGSETQIYPENKMNPGVYVIYGYQILRKKLVVVQ